METVKRKRGRPRKNKLPEEIQQLVNRASDFLNSRQLDEAERIITELEQKTDPTQPTLVRLRSVWNRLKSRRL